MVVHQPLTAEGLIAQEIGLTSGLAKRAGQSGQIYGLDWGSALQMAPGSVDRERLIQALRRWEAGMVDGSMKVVSQPTDPNTQS